MMPRDAAQFVFMTCKPGAEGALKQEVARVEPAWRPSFSRPGFLTFKLTDEKHLDAERLAELVQQFWENPGIAALASSGVTLDLHVWQREPAAVDDGDLNTYVTPLCEEVEAALSAAAPEASRLLRTIAKHRRATARKSRVLDVVLVEPDQWWIGHHVAVSRSECWPGGAIPIRLPSHAVSRAYAKMEEAIQWSNLPVAQGDECVEVGCAPGGASQALLDRGLFVTGIDPADVDSAVLEHQ